MFGHASSWRDLILIAGGLFLVWKATKEIHHNVDPDPGPDVFEPQAATLTATAAVGRFSCWTWSFPSTASSRLSA